ncbi:MAG: aminotransferase class I/II-fold pyridoxal phosphate-dependent enzyme [Kiritimatiellae bacterium]|nr:aminotransferase class I/II-fold pyridoxal phosphate-dependent enzyme [Kiritimatiellia bacterium]
MPYMNKLASELNATLGPAAEFLSETGKRMYFPFGGILGQGAEAKGCALNATIGMAFEEDGSPLVLDSFMKSVNLDKKAFLYAGSFGLQNLREVWKGMQVQKNPSMAKVQCTLPVVTSALTHGLRVCAELFADADDELVIPDLYWDNYELIFHDAVGCKVRKFNTFTRGGRFDAEAMKQALQSKGDKKILILNFPNNPTGYTPTEEDAKSIVAAVKTAVRKNKKVVVLLDDAYFGLVYEEGVHRESLFADFCKADERILAVKLDGTTKEDYVWGMRVGFVTFGGKLLSTPEQLKAMEAKAAGNVRSSISNCSSLGQHMALNAYLDPNYQKQKERKFNVLKRRYNEVKKILKEHPEYTKVAFKPMPFNSGYFMCVKPIAVEPEDVRKRLINKYNTGTIVLSGLIRISFSTVPTQKLKRLFDNLYKAICDLQIM